MVRDPSHELIVADGSDLVRGALIRLLGSSYSIVPVSDGTAALERMAQNPCCSLLTAIRMTPMDGRTLVNEIAERWPERLCKVVVVSGLPDAKVGLPPEVALLPKPVEPEVLRQAIAECVARKPDATNGAPCGAQNLG